MMKTKKNNSYRLVNGPYKPPQVKPGDWLDDEIRGMVEVGGWSNAPIAWPRRRIRGRYNLILCGDLITAVRNESVEAIVHHFGATKTTVMIWREALGVRGIDDGTELKTLPKKAVNRPNYGSQRIRIRNREAIIREGFFDLISPKEKWKIRGFWTPEMRAELIRLYSETSSQIIAERMNRTVNAVRAQANMLGLKKRNYTEYIRWTPEMDAKIIQLYPTTPNRVLVEQFGRSISSIRERAAMFGLKKEGRVSNKSWTEEEHAMFVAKYPTMEGKVLAKIFNRTVTALYAYAVKKGIKKSEVYQEKESPTDPRSGELTIQQSQEKVYTREFREEAVKLVETSGKSFRQVAWQLSIPPASLGGWVREARRRKKRRQEALIVSKLQLELVQLREELDAVKQERDRLKKYEAYFDKKRR